MGLWKILTTPIGNRLRWKEPVFLATRLQGRFQQKLICMAACPLAGMMGMLILREIWNNPTLTATIAMVAGAFMGSSFFWFFFIRDDDIRGDVRLGKNEISRERMRGGLDLFSGWILTVTETWPYRTIGECRIVPRGRSGYSFSILEIFTGGKSDSIGIPRRVDLKELVARLQAEGVSVSQASAPSIDSSHLATGFNLKEMVVAGVIWAGTIVILSVIRPNNPNKQQADADAVFARQNEMMQQDAQNAHDALRAESPSFDSMQRTKEEMLAGSDSEPSERSSASPGGLGDFSRRSRDSMRSRARPTSMPGMNLPPEPPGNLAPPPPSRKPASKGGFFLPEEDTEEEPEEMPEAEPQKQPEEEQPKPPAAAPEPSEETELRTWTSSTGKFQIEAVLVDSRNGKITLRKQDGQTIDVPLDRLSKADRDHVAATKQAAEASRPAKGTKQDTELAGGNEGWEFRHEGTKPLLGISYGLGGWAGEKTVGKITPVFDRRAADDGRAAVIAKPGYAIGAINVEANRFVNAMQIVFMRLSRDGRLDPADSYTSDWIGYRSKKPTKTLGGQGATVLGVYGRHGAILNAVGLIVRY